MLKIEYKEINPHILLYSNVSSIRDNKGRFKKQFKDYVCSICESNETYTHTKFNYPIWYKHPLTNLAVCGRCQATNFVDKKKKAEADKKYYLKNKDQIDKYRKEYSQKGFNFKDKRIFLEYNTRKGVCYNCKTEGITHLHHKKYDDTDPIKYTVELCPSCHIKETWKLKQ